MRTTHNIFQDGKTRRKTRTLIALLFGLTLVAINVRTSKVIATTTASQTTVVLQPTNAPMLNGTFQRIADQLINEATEIKTALGCQ